MCALRIAGCRFMNFWSLASYSLFVDAASFRNPSSWSLLNGMLMNSIATDSIFGTFVSARFGLSSIMKCWNVCRSTLPASPPYLFMRWIAHTAKNIGSKIAERDEEHEHVRSGAVLCRTSTAGERDAELLGACFPSGCPYFS